MRVSRINIQPSLFMLNNKKSSQEMEREIEGRSNGAVNQISIFNSTFDRHVLPNFNEGIQVLIVRKCKISVDRTLEIFGAVLKTVQLSYCHLKQLPTIHSDNLQKLNVSNNEISQILSLPSKNLKLLDIRNNKITKITRQIYNPNITILHQFITKKHDRSFLSLPVCLYPPVIQIKSIVKQSLKGWSNSDLIETCELIIENGNDVLLDQLLPYLSELFLVKIFQISKIKRKHAIIQLLITNSDSLRLTHDEALELLMPEYISQHQLHQTSLLSLIKTFASFNYQKKRVLNFLQFLKTTQKDQSYFIQSQKDLINFMSYNVTYPNNYEAQFLMTQLVFFNDYDFSNNTILRYLLQFDNLKLLKKLLDLPIFCEKMFCLGLYKKLLKANKKSYKFLLKQDRIYRNALKYKNDLYFPQYRERKSFCLKNDLYDYEILSQYEQMQCSYSHKDLKFTLKFCNKENEISVAKRIQTQLKRKNVKNMEFGKSHYSTNASTYNV